MSGTASRRKLAFPYLLIFGILSISVAILDLGWSVIHRQRQQQAALQRDDEARQILGTMVYGSSIDPYLTRIATYLRKRLPGILEAGKSSPAGNARQFLQSSFPQHEIWAFACAGPEGRQTAETRIFPDQTAISRRGMANAFAALQNAEANPRNDKLIDFLFGPGLTVKSLALRQGVPTRIIYRNRHHLLVWDKLMLNSRPVGGFSLLLPDSAELKQYAMTISARSATAGRFHAKHAVDKRCMAGYLKIFPEGFASVLPDQIRKNPEIARFMQENEINAELAALERAPLPWARKYGEWELYTHSIPYSSHLAFVLLPQASLNQTVPGALVFGNWLYVALTTLFLLGWCRGIAFPPLSLRSRFSMLFVSLAAIPFSLFLLATSMYLEELRISMLREARQKMFSALSSFDQGVEDVYQLYRSEIQKLHQQKWLLQALEDPDSPADELLEKAGAFMQSLSPPLPWGALLFLNAEGKTVQTFRSAHHQRKLTGYNKFNRIGLLDAIRKTNGMPDLDNASSSKYVSDSDLAIKEAFATLVRLPVSHGFLNKSVGQPAQVAFGSFSIVRIFDYFPSLQKPKIAFAVAWLEEELDRYFCALALRSLQREYPGSRFAVFRSEADGLKTIARTHKESALAKSAFAASLRNGFSFALSPHSRRMEVAFSSQRRPGIILAGEMDASFIDEKLNALTQRFFMFAIIGILAIIFFHRLLSQRLILPFLLLQKSLANVTRGDWNKLPALARRDEIARIFAAFNEMLDGLKARQRLLSLVSGKALQIAVEKPDVALSEPAGTVPVIAMVSDIRDFTTLCGNYPPEVITGLLNTHFDRMTRIIHAQGGEVTRFVGDAIEASFPCNAAAVEESCRRAVSAGLIMLQSMALINEERERQGMFTYKIGIGLSSGRSHVFRVGRSGGRSEVLQVGEPFKQAAELEALSKKFVGQPLIMDAEMGKWLSGTPEYADLLSHQKIDGTSLSGFVGLPAQESYLDNSEVQHSAPSFKQRRSYEQLVSGIKAGAEQFLPGLILLLIPLLIVIFGIYSGFARHRHDLRQTTQEKTQQVLASEKIYLARKEKVEMQLHKTIAAFPETTGRGISPFKNGNQEHWQRLITEDLHSSGLKPEEIVFASQADLQTVAANTMPSDSGKTRKDKLTWLLQECLRCYRQNFDRFVTPDPQKISLLGESMSGILLTRDTRSRFEPVTIASTSFWLYWQPVLDQQLLREYQSSMPGSAAGAMSDEMRLFGRFSPEEYDRFLMGGVLVLCRPPSSLEQLRQKADDLTTLSARINLKKMSIIEERGNFDPLFDKIGSFPQQISRAEKLVALAHQQNGENTGWVIDKALTGGGEALLSVIAMPVPALSHAWSVLEQSGYFLCLLCMILAVWQWYRAVNERAMAKTVNGQILGSFMATMLVPVAGIFMVLVLLVGDWQNNMLKDSETGFLHQVDLMEQKVRFHHYLSPQKVQKMLANGDLNSLLLRDLPADRESHEFKETRAKLLKFLDTAFAKIMVRSQALGVNSIMVDSLNGLSEYLCIDGSLSPENDPMKRAFSFHASRVMARLDSSARDSSQPGDANKLLVDEMTAQIIFEILDSTFGSDASTEIHFGQGKGVELFSSVSNDVLFQHQLPDAANPMATIFTIFSHLHSNQFAMARILAARHFQRRHRDPLEFEIFAASKLSPGLPLTPETGETRPFLREIARQTMLAGNMGKSVEHNGREYHTVSHASVVVPQFIFVGIADKAQFRGLIINRLAQFMAVLLLFFFLLFLLSLHTSRDITGPLAQFLFAVALVKQGNYHTRLLFNREDELEQIAVEFNGMVRQLAEKDILASMVSESALAMANSDQAETDAQRGMRREAAVAYFGIVGFADYLNQQGIEDLPGRLAVWVEKVCATVLANGGEVDKIMEGRILAVFFADSPSGHDSAEIKSAGHIDRAFLSAVQICNDSAYAGLPACSCGIHAGTVISGLIGNQSRRDFTVIGDSVNMAARCFSITETLKGSGLVVTTEQTMPSLSNRFTSNDLGPHQIKGKKAPVRLFMIAME